MKRMRTLGLAVAAMCALAAFAATSAFALPEVGRCKAVAGTGKYTESNCNTKAKPTGTGNFEFFKGAAKVGFTATSGEAVLEGESGVQVVCKSSNVTGKLDADGTKGAIKGVESVISTYHNCAIPTFGITCQSTGAAAESIVTNELEGNLVYAVGGKASKEVLQELKPAKSAKGKFTEFSCGAGAVVVKVESGPKAGGNCIFAPVTSVNTMSATNGQVYKGSKGVQSPQHDEKNKPPICNLESSVNGEFERSGQTQTNVITFEEPLELKA
jgi:hypothetical protein